MCIRDRLQVVKRILAPMGNEVITLVKDTSLANTIAKMCIRDRYFSSHQR